MSFIAVLQFCVSFIDRIYFLRIYFSEDICEAIPFFHIRTSKPVILSGMMPHIFHIGCTLQNWDSSLDLHPSDICYDIFHRRRKFFYCIPYGKCWLYSVVRRLLQVDTWLYRRTGRQTGSRLKLWSKYMLSQKTALPVLRVTPGAYLKVEFHLPAFLPGKCIRKTPGCSFPAHWPS